MHELNELIALHNPNELENIAVNISDPLNTDLIHIVRKMDPHVIMLFNGGRLRNKLKLDSFPVTFIYNNKTKESAFHKTGYSSNSADEVSTFLKNKTKSD